jgi:hypothetical protein
LSLELKSGSRKNIEKLLLFANRRVAHPHG